MTSSAPQISVCLLAYNNASILKQTIESILQQEFTDFELIVSDDCSKDDTWDVAQAFAAQDSRVRPIRPPTNLGMAGNANFAVAASTAPYIALLHHDDIYSLKLLQRWADVLTRHPSVAFVSNAYAIHNRERVDYHPFDECTPGILALEKYLLPIWGCPVRGTAMIRRSCWDAVGGMRTRFGLLADVDLWMRLAARWDVGYVREPLITVREDHPKDYPAEYSRWSWERMRILYDIHGTNRREYYADRPLRRLLELAHFRARVSADELHWFAYALYKWRLEMLTTSAQVENEYELAPVRWLRKGMSHLATRTFKGAK